MASVDPTTKRLCTKGMPENDVSGLVKHPEQTLDLIKFEQIGFGHVMVGGHHNQIVREHRGVVPVKAAFDDNVLVNHTVFGMYR